MVLAQTIVDVPNQGARSRAAAISAPRLAAPTTKATAWTVRSDDGVPPAGMGGGYPSGDAVAHPDVAVGRQEDDAVLGVERAEDEDLGADRADLPRREVDHADDEAAFELLAGVVGDLGRRALDPDVLAEVDGQLPGRLARLGEG